MRQGTTPIHTFALPCDASKVSVARVTYEQKGKIVLEKSLETNMKFLVENGIRIAEEAGNQVI